jgi:hypothetical protein
MLNQSLIVLKKAMSAAYVLINSDIDHKYEVMKELSKLPGKLDAAELDAAYDIETINGFIVSFNSKKYLMLSLL